MTSTSRIARATACAFLLAIPAAAVADQATIRIEGSSQTLLPETSVPIATGTSTVSGTDKGGGSTRTIAAGSHIALTQQVGGRAGLGIAWWLYGFGSMLNQVGPDAAEPWPGATWRLKVNNADSMVSDQDALSPGDRVVWAYGLWADMDDAVDLSTAENRRPIGQNFSFTVRAHDSAGSPLDPAGIEVVLDRVGSVTNSTGQVSLAAQQPGWTTVTATRAQSVRGSTRVCAYPADDPTVCDLPARPTATAPAPAPALDNILRIPVTLTVRGKDVAVTADVPLPAPGAAPVAVRRSMIGGADLSPAEMRRAMGVVASAVAAHLNAKAAGGDAHLALPAGVRWQAAWLSGAPYVAPLRRGESLMGIRTGGPRNTAAIRQRARGLNGHLNRCGMRGTTGTVRRHGYAMATLTPSAARRALVTCVAERAS